MSDSVPALKAWQPACKFHIAIDSDGCVFDTMEIKHKECFIPNIIQYWDLQAVSKYAREAAEFVNLYSKWRGINRFPALIRTLDLLADWPEAMRRGIALPELPNLRRWIETETKLGNPALEAYCREHPDPDMHRALEWSKAVNVRIHEVVKGGLPPFPFVRECLEQAQGRADLMVCSQTPTEALVREWEEQGLDHFVFTINGQEMGTKGEHIQFATEGKYAPDAVLMIGDAFGDLKAARTNKALFFPINPGDEDASWQRLHEEGLDRFFNGTFAGEYEAKLIAEFEKFLPETPRWKC